ncbi:MAG: WD40 repeat domain-containing protein, partial [Cyanobacteria bacterium J06633_2]
DASFSRDDQRIVITTGRYPMQIDAPSEVVPPEVTLDYPVGLSPDSLDVLTRVWDLESGRHIGDSAISESAISELEYSQEEVVGIGFSSNSTHVVTVRHDNTIEVRKGESKEATVELNDFVSSEDSGFDDSESFNSEIFIPENLFFDGIFEVSFSLNGQHMLIVDTFGQVVAWDLWAKERILIEHFREHPVISASISDDGTRFVTTHEGGNIVVRDFQGNIITEFYGYVDGNLALKFSHDNHSVYTVGDNNALQVWDATQRNTFIEIESPDAELDFFKTSLSHDGAVVATITQDNSVQILDSQSGESLLAGESLPPIEGGSQYIESVVMSHDGRFLLTIDTDDNLRIWNVQLNSLTQMISGHLESGHHAAVISGNFSHDGTRIVTASEDGTARVWDITSGELIRTLGGHKDTVISASFSHDDTRVVTASADYTAKVWDISSGELIRTLGGHKDTVISASFSHDDTRIVTASADYTARIWDAKLGGDPLKVLTGHRAPVVNAYFNNAGTRILTASMDRAARVWDVQSQQPLQNFQGYVDTVFDARFNYDETHVVTFSEDHMVRTWQIEDLDTLLEKGCEHLADYFETYPEQRDGFSVCQ